MAVNERIEEA